ncbi:hypothetical protein CEXT_59211 [Caerostris extrusa]|uniref:EGF-like domain-containing protein n=1 Tax=Caerostris extrusa TaxID=172846 RepID=A0AAV4MC61_CAEEX|nr:hypothetical protein CEXT_59211 [Caerostris extrusa]
MSGQLQRVSRGHCVQEDGQWSCRCHDGWGGKDCKTRQETKCADNKDNDSGKCFIPEVAFVRDSFKILHSVISSIEISNTSQLNKKQ